MPTVMDNDGEWRVIVRIYTRLHRTVCVAPKTILGTDLVEFRQPIRPFYVN